MRDPFQYSDATLVMPPELVPCLEFFDGAHSALDLKEFLVRLTQDLDVSDLERHLVETLEQAGFLEDEHFRERKEARERDFAEAPLRHPSHAGGGYPDAAWELKETFDEYMNGASPRTEAVPLAIAAPHVSPFGGIEAYRAAYAQLTPAAAGRTFVILGTSHYGEPDRFGLTRKPFVTPYGEAQTDRELVDRLERDGGDAVKMEDYCHAVEHSIEFQVVFLQHLFGPQVRIVPILCGSYALSFSRKNFPDDSDRVRRMTGALGEMASRERDKLIWILGVDMAHMGRRYGDPFVAHAGRDQMEEVSKRDHARIERMTKGDAPGFWEMVRENDDDLKWCGSAPIYSFLRAVPNVRGTLLQYQQWNIDENSVVSFAGMRFD